MEKVAARAITIPALGDLLLRPVLPTDASALICFFNNLTREDIHSRFFSGLPRLPDRYLRKLLATDFEHELALLLVNPISCDVLGVVRVVEAETGPEISITVRSDIKHHGVGRLLMAEALAWSRDHGVREVHAEILADNRASIGLARQFGFAFSRAASDPYIVHATLHLDTGVAA
jgi:acetyltransferase